MSSVDAESLTREKEKEGKTLQTLAPHSMEPNTFHQGYASYSGRADTPGRVPGAGQIRPVDLVPVSGTLPLQTRGGQTSCYAQLYAAMDLRRITWMLVALHRRP